MRWSRFILYPLIAFQALFLNVLLPGHTRGQVTLDGKHTAACCCCDSSTGQPAKGETPAVPSQRDRDNCSMCSFAAGLTTAVYFTFALEPAGLLDVLPVPPPLLLDSRDLIPTYHACGPPAAFACV